MEYQTRGWRARGSGLLVDDGADGARVAPQQVADALGGFRLASTVAAGAVDERLGCPVPGVAGVPGAGERAAQRAPGELDPPAYSR
jgi:hypothetical protein